MHIVTEVCFICLQTSFSVNSSSSFHFRCLIAFFFLNKETYFQEKIPYQPFTPNVVDTKSNVQFSIFPSLVPSTAFDIIDHCFPSSLEILSSFGSWYMFSLECPSASVAVISVSFTDYFLCPDSKPGTKSLGLFSSVSTLIPSVLPSSHMAVNMNSEHIFPVSTLSQKPRHIYSVAHLDD